MSAGDIDNTLGDLDYLNDLRAKDPKFDQYLTMAWNLSPNRNFFQPFGAGINVRGTRPYISYDIRTVIRDIECTPALVRHETTEWALREFFGIGEEYAADPRGHRLANRVEHDLVLVLLKDIADDPWEIYNEIIEQQIVEAERRDFHELPVPRDLALYPYEDDEDMLRALREAMLSDRSMEEWDRLNESNR